MAAAAAPPHLAGHHCITITPLPVTHQQRQHHRNSTVPSPFTLRTIVPAPFPTTASSRSTIFSPPHLQQQREHSTILRAPPAARNRSESRKLRRTTHHHLREPAPSRRNHHASPSSPWQQRTRASTSHDHHEFSKTRGEEKLHHHGLRTRSTTPACTEFVVLTTVPSTSSRATNAAAMTAFMNL
ncbi:hypothetical protein DEO72_LG2g2959 [Vigna unguiculata]|uniref:Uncharacterized protein n=1 Tax=Vigna unguiculata TaxID=3917 RepID=A0A4D6L2A4_VIGUN|nr:hypothetical protein DEO72_LG2g2959 [Vigna unguiculata]